MTEAELQRTIQAALCRDAEIRLFRNNVGVAWTGAYEMRPNGDVVIHHPRRIQYGLAVGSADLIGLRSMLVQPADVGRRIARFASVEVKSPGKHLQSNQRAWRNMVRDLGGLAGDVHDVKEALDVLWEL